MQTNNGLELASQGAHHRDQSLKLEQQPMLRSGFLASAASRGASIFKMMDVSRHHLVVALRGYVRDAELFQNHAGEGLLAGPR